MGVDVVVFEVAVGIGMDGGGGLEEFLDVCRFGCGCVGV